MDAKSDNISVRVQFHAATVERLVLGDAALPFGRKQFYPTSQGISNWCGAIKVIAQGALLYAYEDSNTMMWVATSKGRGPAITSDYPILVRSSATIYVGRQAETHPGHSFKVAVHQSQELEAQRPEETPVLTEHPRQIKLTDRQRHAIAALTADYPMQKTNRAQIRAAKAAALPHRPMGALSGEDIVWAMREVAQIFEKAGMYTPRPGTGSRQQLCDWLVDRGVVGPVDWDAVRPWLR